ncbi:hypothetical protein [Ktedonobacter robiniae]|uniref:Uncharacterized protein n=1 Tax=Ktedonobacter robiniae TaxID=2778365 RepID=A0ABQ3UUS6_9CHLR|nr:hypothetical protein [Ktedonobacter robiniae]GHO56422.1 hypothetical protein KSB_48970 [Ktedonobacter robiniae]
MSQVFPWTRWLAIASGMLHKRYARTPQTPSFPDRVVSYQTKASVPRKRGKGKPKEKWVTHSRTYTTVSYGLSETAPRPAAAEAPEPTSTNKRKNWLVQAQPEDLLYEQRIIDTFTRSYPTRKDGTRREGEVTVKHPDPKWVPLLRPALRKRQVIKKAVARAYEENTVPPEQETPPANPPMPSEPFTKERNNPSC